MSKVSIKLTNKNSVYKSRLKDKYLRDGIPEEGIELAFIIAEYKLKNRISNEFPPSRWESIFNTNYRLMIKDLTSKYIELLGEE